MEWGIRECVDFGNIVFTLVNNGLLGKTDEDSIEAFMGGSDFSEAFDYLLRPKEITPCLLGKSIPAD